MPPTATPPAPDLWQWRARYRDDGQSPTELWEYDEDGTQHVFAEVDQDRLEWFDLIPQYEGLKAHTLKVPEGPEWRAIFYRHRFTQVASYADGSFGDPRLVRTHHMLGLQYGDDEAIQFKTHFYFDGSVRIGGPELLTE